MKTATFYLDESIFSHLLADALLAQGVQIRRPGVDVPYGTPDEEWLKLAGRQRWIVLMRDQRVRHRANEIQALRAAKVGAFILTAGQASAQESVLVILRRLRKMVNISVSEKRPFVYTLAMSGALVRLKLRGR